MSQPNSATLRYSSSSQPPVKTLSNSLKTTQEKPVLQLNKFELKSLSDTIGLYSEKSSARQQDSQAYSSQTPQNQQVYSHQHYSPTNSARKAPINPLTKAKNNHEKKSSLKLSLETLDFKDAISGSKKAYPTTSKATKATYSTNPVEKLKNSTKKSVSISKEEKVKSFLSTYETLFDRKSPTNKDANNKIKYSLYQKELRNNFMEEPQKKSSLPNNLALALHNIYANTGSNSHRTSTNTGPTEPTQTIANNNEMQQQTYGQPRTHKKSYEGEYTAQIITNSSNVVPQVQLQTHQGPTKYSFNGADSVKNISKISSMKNSQVVAEERKGNLKDSLDFTNMLKEKNDEIQKLMKDKNELKATVEILITQINDMKRTKSNASGEKDETGENLTPSVVEILGSTNESKETYKENKSQSARQLQKQLQNAKKINNNNYMSKDMESVKILVDQLKHMTDDSEKVINKALEQKNTLIETLTKENLRKSKKTNYNSFEKKDSKKPQSQLSNFNPYQRSSSMTGDDLMGKKVQGSPYFDPLKATKKSSKDSTSTLATKKPISAGLSSSTHSNNRGKEGSKGELYIDTAGGLETVSSLMRTQPNTTTNSDLEMLRRKFSHDPKLISEFISEMFEKRSLGDGMEEYNYESGKGKGSAGQDGRVDIGSALNELKGRISGLLGRYKSEKIANKQQK